MIENPGMPLLHELGINDDDVKYPPAAHTATYPP